MLGTLAGVCGIVAVIGRRDDREALEASAVVPLLHDVAAQLAAVTAGDASAAGAGGRDLAEQLEAAAVLLREADDALRSLPGVRLLVDDAKCVLDIEAALATVDAHITEIDGAVDAGEVLSETQSEPDGELDCAGARIERINAALGELKDHGFALRRDRLRMAREIVGLWGGTPPPTAIGGLWSIQVALSALDRLEVRGRDSAGLQVFVQGARLDADAEGATAGSHSARLADPLFGAGAVRNTPDGLAFVYKTASEIGELGDNTSALRSQIRQDSLLRWALCVGGAEVVVVSHTRWASIGIVSVPNAHPLDAWTGSDDRSHVAAVLNGDVDNYADLIAQRRLSIAPEITTDAKVIPTMFGQALTAGSGGAGSEQLRQAFAGSEQLRQAFAGFDCGKPSLGLNSCGKPSLMPSAASRVRWRLRRTPRRCPKLWRWRCGEAGRRSMSARRGSRTWLPASRTAWSRNVASTCVSMASPLPIRRTLSAAGDRSCSSARRFPQRLASPLRLSSPPCDVSPMTALSCLSNPATSSLPR